MAKRNGLPPNVTEFKDRHGKWRLRFRAQRRPTYYFKARFGSEEFHEELIACRSGRAATAALFNPRTRPGSIAALISQYYSTPEFTGLKVRTRVVYRGELERFRIAHGDKSVVNLKRMHIKAILGEMADRPNAANNLLDRLRSLMRLAVDEEWRETDPTLGIKGFKIKSTGFHSWTEAEIEVFEKKYDLGTRPRLAFDLLLYTNQRRSDVIVLGRQHRKGNSIYLSQQKTGTELQLDLHPDLIVSINAASSAGITGDLTYLVTQFGRPFTAAGFGNAMRVWCDDAGLQGCSAHGLRKAGARRMAEAGKTNPQIKSVTGHKTDKEVGVYVAAASQKELAKTAISGLSRPKKQPPAP